MQKRDFLKYMLATTAGGSWLTQSVSTAMAATAPKSLVVIFQRGGCDGLNVMVPYAENEYYNLRPTIAIAPPGSNGGALDLDGFFGLHPAMSSLYDLYQRGNVAAFPAVHYTNASRSHFDSQQYIENAEVNRGNKGWLNRHLSSSENSVGMRGVSFGSSLARALDGPVSVSAFSDLRNLDLDLDTATEQRLINRLSGIYNQNTSNRRPYDDLLRRSGRTFLNDLNFINSIDVNNYQVENGANYPRNNYGRQLAQTAQLIKTGAGLELATIDLAGWDTHFSQGGATGAMASRLGDFSDGIAAFYQDLGSQMTDVMVLTMTEFGRTARENGSGGTDHGHASAWFAIGGGINGGIYGAWPGLAESQRVRGRYLAQATDFRDIYSEILVHHLGNPSDVVVPNYTANPIGFFA